MAKHRTIFSHELRVLACPQCAAPIEAGLAGGSLACTYCRATLVVAARDERDDRLRGQAARLSESERFARLREQVGKRWFPSGSVRAFVDNGVMPPTRVGDAVARWQQVRGRLMKGEATSFILQEELLHLTLLLQPHLRANRQRARGVLEAALELLDDPTHRQVLRCQLIEEAIREGDLAGAETWLDGLDPHATDIHADGAYRIAMALLAAARGSPSDIRAVLGDDPAAIPWAYDHYVPAAALRAHSYELQGYVDTATSQLCHVMTSPAPGEQPTASRGMMVTPQGLVPMCAVHPTCEAAVDRFITDAGWPFRLCPTAYPAARTALTQRAALRPPIPLAPPRPSPNVEQIMERTNALVREAHQRHEKEQRLVGIVAASIVLFVLVIAAIAIAVEWRSSQPANRQRVPRSGSPTW